MGINTQYGQFTVTVVTGEGVVLAQGEFPNTAEATAFINQQYEVYGDRDDVKYNMVRAEWDAALMGHVRPM